jgi:steroid delta-isomerase-like uncharacterized protein
MTREQVVELFTRRDRAIARRDLPSLLGLYADDAELESPLAGSVSGRDAVARVYDAFFAAFPDATFQMEEPLVDGDSAAQVTSVAGTHTGPFLGLSPSGKPFRFSMVIISSVRDGHIARERRIYDFAGLLIQLGVLKAKPA